MFNGRYELLRRIARGGMADVFLARDASLSRKVAVKVLFPEFANDPSFVERFRREAKAAANLNHPNIVGIYDWGQEQGTYYIVMEYVVGRNMVEVLHSTGRLSPDRAAEIALEVAGALNSAHNAGLVHRDIKLGNIIVSNEGQVKVADFGIATALARSTGDNLTHIGSVMGTATYFSPEQAQGKALDGRSDLYSLGVALYEMVVGKPPFTAETATAVAVKHVQERPLAPSTLGITITESLEAIILKLLAKNPVNRYPRADDLCSDLRRYLAGAHSIKPPKAQQPESPAQPAGAPIQSSGSSRPSSSGSLQSDQTPQGQSLSDSWLGAELDSPLATGTGPQQPTPPQQLTPQPPTLQSPAAQPSAPATGPVTYAPPAASGDPYATADPSTAGMPYPSGARYAPPPSGGPPGGKPPAPPSGQEPQVPYNQPPAYYYETVHRSDGWKRGLLMLLGLGVLVGALGFLAVAFYQALGLDDDDDPVAGNTAAPVESLVDVPDVSGLSYGEADARLRAVGLVPQASYQINTAFAENTVFAQSPPSGQRVTEGATVALTVSQGETPRVPPVRGRNRIDATNILVNSGYEVIVVNSPDQAEAGIVVGQDPPPNTELLPGDAVTITVSIGPGQIFVPDVRNMTLTEAIQTLVAKGFRVNDRTEPSTTVAEGQIIDTDPPYGFPVSAGLEVTIIVSEGLPLIAIPDVQGLLFDTGKLTIEGSGLVVGNVTFEPVEPSSAEVGRILTQTPPPNLEVSSGTLVDVVVGEPADPEAVPPPSDAEPQPGSPPESSPPESSPPESSPPGSEDETEGLEQSGTGQPGISESEPSA